MCRLPVVYWNTCKPFRTSPFHHYGAHHNDSIPFLKLNNSQRTEICSHKHFSGLFRRLVFRSAGSDGSEGRLGAYHYALKPYDLSKNYFYINNRKAYSAGLSPKLFYVYAVFCKLMCNDIARFYQSLNDLSALIRLSRAEVSKVIAVLIDRSMVRKQLKRTRAGDYTDNTYFIVTRKQGCIKKAGPRSNRSCSNGLCPRGSSQLKQLYNNTSDGICQSFLRKFLLYKPILFYYGGSP